jgi:signal transduction histidine kinase/ligand-binding sensor domain-containing protein
LPGLRGVAVAFLVGWAIALPAANGGYLVKNWSTADGIPHNTIRAVLESRDGYLWLGTANGLARFDGVRFTVFDAANTPELISDNVFSLFEDRRGTLWIRTRSGLARRSQGRFEFLSPTNSVQPVPFAGMMEDKDGTLWVQGFNGLGRWNGRVVEPVPLPAIGPQEINALQPAVEGGLWISAGNGLWRFRDGQVTFVTKSPVAEHIATGPGGQLWGLAKGERLLKFERGTWQPVASLPGENCNALYAAPNGDVWLGSERRNAAYRWRDGILTTFSSAEGLEGVRVLNFVQDHDGNVWIALNAGGLYRLREQRVQLIGREQGFESPNTTSVIEQPDGTVMVGVMSSTLHRIAQDKAEPIRVQPAQEPFAHPTALAPAREGGVWAGRFFGSLPRIQDGRVVEEIGSSNGTRALFVDAAGRLWRGMRAGGIEVFAGASVTRYAQADGLSFDNVYCFAQDRDDAIWAGTEHGLNRIHNGRITVFGTTNGLGNLYISALCLDSRGTLWVGTLGGGLSAWTGSNFVTLTTRDGLAHDAVDQLIEDDLGHLWIGTRIGLMRLSVAQLHAFLRGGLRVVTGTLLGRDEGLLRPNFWTEYQPASAKSRDGRLWFCTGSGVAVVDPRRFEKPAAAPLLHIEEVAIDGRTSRFEPREELSLKFPPGSERLQIRYTAISPSEPAQVRFRHRLVGYDRDWIEAGRARVASYSHLPPGDYQFQVIAVNNDGIWNTAGAGLAFQVQPQFWQTAWFRVALGLALVGFLSLLFRTRTAQLERRRQAQEAFSRRLIESQENERKRIAAELHDSLGQNLLVIKNRADLALKQRDDAGKMADEVSEVSTITSAALREVREIAQNLRPFQIDEFGLTKAITAMARKVGDASGMQIRTDLDNIDRALLPEFEINFYRIIQECLNNIAKHAQAATASIVLRREARALRLMVQDDGCGFAIGDDSYLEGRGFGLKNITERARTMGGDVRIHSSPGAGTRVEVTIPVR